MTKEELLIVLKRCADDSGPAGDAEAAHINADEALLLYIDDAEIETAWRAVERWYS